MTQANNAFFPEPLQTEGIVDYYFDREGTFREWATALNAVGGPGESRATINPDGSVLLKHRWDDGKRLHMECSRDTAHFAYLSTTCGGEREHGDGHPTYQGLIEKLLPVLKRSGIKRLTAVTQDEASTMVLQRHGEFEWQNGLLVWDVA